jgi:adenylate kinase
MHVILMGAQGAGKGTQAERLAPRLKLTHLSTGDVFRGEIKSGSELGARLKAILDAGELVPDQLTLDIVNRRLDAIAADPESHGALFDGFPRTTAQAEGLDQTLAARSEQIAAVVEIAVPRPHLVERLAGRRVCPICGATYHLEFNPPRVPGLCDKEGAELIQRADDTPDAINRRLDLYFEQTEPLLAYYEARGLLKRVDGDQPIEAVTDQLVAAIELAGKNV